MCPVICELNQERRDWGRGPGQPKCYRLLPLPSAFLPNFTAPQSDFTEFYRSPDDQNRSVQLPSAILLSFTAPQHDFTEFYRSNARFYRILPLPRAILPNFTVPQNDFGPISKFRSSLRFENLSQTSNVTENLLHIKNAWNRTRRRE